MSKSVKIPNSLINSVLKPSSWPRFKTKPPLLVNLIFGKTKVIMVGVNHTNDPKSKTIKKIESEFKKINNSKNRPIILIGERRIKKNYSLPSKDEAIHQYSESGLIAWLAAKNKYSYFCPEPSFKDLINQTIQMGWKPEDLIIWTGFNLLSYAKNNHQFADLLPQIISKINLYSDQNLKYQSSVKKIKSNLEKLLQKQLPSIPENWPPFLTVSDQEKIRQAQIPKTKGLITNQISYDLNWVRDLFLAKNIINKLPKHKTALIVYGSNHILSISPAFNLS